MTEEGRDNRFDSTIGRRVKWCLILPVISAAIVITFFGLVERMEDLPAWIVFTLMGIMGIAFLVGAYMILELIACMALGARSVEVGRDRLAVKKFLGADKSLEWSMIGRAEEIYIEPLLEYCLFKGGYATILFGKSGFSRRQWMLLCGRIRNRLAEHGTTLRKRRFKTDTN